MNENQHSIVILSETMPLGGTSTFALNICKGMIDSGRWNCVAGGLREIGEIGEQILEHGLPAFGPDAGCLLHEDRIEYVYRECSKLSANAVVAALSSGPFDFLRYVPEGCLRIGMIQSDDGCVYDLVERYLPWIDIVCGVSQEICRKMEERLGSRRIPVVHQPYGVPMPRTEPVRTSNGPLRVLYLGRVIEEQKRVGLMARVMKRTLAEVPELQWTIAGDGPDLAAMREDFSGEPERVHFLGGIPYQEVPAVVAAHDAYFLCSDYEGLPLSLLESMGAGLVPVVSNLPSGISEVVNDDNGIRVDIHDEAGFADGIIHLANHPKLRASMSRQASEQVRNSHSTGAMAQRWVDMLESQLPAQPPVWKSSCTATAPMELDGKWQFSPTLRPVRKMLKRLKR
jgi:glycosyltransferase involved in cell wall biosynthesis